MNQYLTRLVFSRVKPLLILSVLLTALFMVTACGGVTIGPNTTNIIKGPGEDEPCETNPFGKDCTVDVDVADQVTFCRDDSKKTDTKAADCEDTIMVVCSGNPFDSLCADDPMVQVEQVAFCRDDSKTTTTKDTDCAGDLITNACDANPFDSLCVGAYLVDDSDRLAFCRDTSREPADKAVNCAGMITTYCDDDNNKFNDGCDTEAGIDDERTQLCLPNQTLDSTRCPTLVMNYCDDDNNKFNDGCNNEAGIDAERTQLCLPNQALDSTRCPTLVMNYCDDDNNKFNDGCDTQDSIGDERTQLCLPDQSLDSTRCPTLVMNYCDIDKNKFETGCNNESDIAAERGKLCVENTAPDRSNCGTELVAGGYIHTYCNSGAGLEDTMNCSDTIAAVLLVTCTGNPWADGCIAADYYSERLAFCAPSATLPEGEDRATVCPPLAEITCKNGDSSVTANPFHATCFVNPTYANDRANLCSTGMQGDNDCNTIPIEAAVCAVSGAYANPFAAFCGDETGTSTSATIPTVIQAALDTCTDTNMDADDGICENTLTDRTRLSDETCIVTNPLALFATQCDYTQFRDVEIDYCDEPTTTWETRCGDVSAESEVKMARDNSCLASGKNAGIGNDCETRDNVREACKGNPYTPTGIGTDAPDVTICTGTDRNEVNYSVARDACETAETSFAENCNLQDEDETAVKLARDMACAKFGIDAGMEIMAVNDCATRPSIMTACTTASPFTNEGCDTATHITREIREAYCTNGTTDIFNPKCGLLTDTMDRIEGTNDARETACLNSPDGTPIDESCRTNGRVVMACTTDPFTKIGCENVGTIAGIRRTFCTITDIFNPICGDTNDYGDTNEARRDACLADTAGGRLSDPSCPTDALAEIACEPDPFNAATPGCANLKKNRQYRIAYCTSGLNIFNPNCNGDVYGATNAARDTECRKTGTSTLEWNTCADIVSMICIANPFEKTTNDTSVNLCVGGNYDTDRETRCRKRGTSDLGSCDETISSLCRNNPFIKTTIGTAIDLCDSSYDDDRKALCLKTGRSPLPGNTCTTLVSEACTDNPFEIGTVSKALLCIDKSGTAYADARKTACLKGTAEDGLVGGKCYTLAHGSDGMTGFCDGADATDNPYAAVCGENGTAQSTFCTSFNNMDNPPAMQLCSTDITVVCPNTPFRNSGGVDCLGDGNYDENRKQHCSDGRQKDASLCNTPEIADAVCISDSDGTHANPFATFCETATLTDSTPINTLKQTFCGDARLTDSSQKQMDCDDLIDGLCSGAKSLQMDVGAADYNCLGDSTANVMNARTTFCEHPVTTFSPECTDDYGNVTQTRRTECLKTGTVAEAVDPSNLICNDVVMTACIANPFQKATININIDLCIDTSGTTYADAREIECRKMGTSPLEGSDCSNIVSTRCNANPFELTTVSLANLCDETAHPRLAFCRDTDRDHADKAGNCISAIDLACTADRFAQKTGTTVGNLCPADHAADLAFCLDNNKPALNKMMNCVGTIQTACVDNPFDVFCINEFSTTDTEKLTFCRDPSKTPEGKADNCTGELITTGCVANPFDVFCIGTYLVNDTDKLAFCRDTDRNPPGKAYNCTTGKLITDACVANPFETFCSTIELGNTANKLQFCRGNRTHDDKAMNCSGELIENACNANPFDGFCVGEYKKTTEEELAFCRALDTSQSLRPSQCTSGPLAKQACLENVYDTDFCFGDNFNDAAEVAFCRDTDRPHAQKSENCGASLAIRAACLANPFTKTTGTEIRDFCTGVYITQPHRLAFCSSIDRDRTVRNANCGDTITNACDANPFEKTNSQRNSYTPVYLCSGDYLTDDYRLAFCRDPSRNTNNLSACDPTIMTVCNANPFEEKTGGGNLCDETTYPRLAFCSDTSKDGVVRADNCGNTIMTACTANPFEQNTDGVNLCDEVTYPRLAFCGDDNKPTDTKADDCKDTIAGVCDVNPYDDICTPDHAAQLAFCEGDATKTPTQETQCSITRSVCPNNPFDIRCSVDTVARLAFCRGDKTHADKADNCAITTQLIITACVANPFDSLCPGSSLGNDDNKLAFCLDTDRTPDTKTADCMVMISTACTANPFEQQTGSAAANLCSEMDYPRFAFCSNPSKTHDDKDTNCRNMIANACNTNPFAKTTGGTSTDLCPAAYLTPSHRDAFCRDSGKQTDTKTDDCSTILAQVCLYNPFETSSTDVRVDLCTPAQTTQEIIEAFCRDISKKPRFKANNCRPTKQRVCNNNPDPFDAYCPQNEVKQLEFCRAGQLANDNAGNGKIFRATECNSVRAGICQNTPDIPVCLDDNADKVTTGDWLRGFDTPLAKSSAAQSRGHQFLQIDSNVTRHNATHLNLGNAVFDNLPLNVDGSGGDDGVVFWHDPGKDSNYVGIAPDTDLGAPFEVRTTASTLQWRGQIRAIGGGRNDHGEINSDLTVNITFYPGLNNGNVGWIGAGVAQGGSGKNQSRFGGGGGYYINGTFNPAGVLRGRATLNTTRYFSEENPTIVGDLRGLIGAEGIIGAFFGSSAAGSSVAGDFVGGFVAQPGVPLARAIVDDAVWVASPSTGTLHSSPPTSENRGNQFLKHSAFFVRDQDINIPNPTDPSTEYFSFISETYVLARQWRVRGNVLSLNSGGLGRVYYRSGFTLWVNTDSTRYYYAGLSSTADVGLMIHTNPAHYPANVNGMATWSGQFKATRNGEDNTPHTDRVYHVHQDLDLLINFTNKRVSGTVRNGPTFGTETGSDGKFDISGNWDTRGVLTGTVNQTTDHGGDNGNGILTGIIGDRGALGAFISEGTGKPGFSGGFFACPAYNPGTGTGDGRCP